MDDPAARLFGALAGVAAFSPESDAWLDAQMAALDVNRRLLADLLAEVSLELRGIDGAALRPVTPSGAGAGETAPTEETDTAARAAEAQPTPEPALALVGAGQPARAALRHGKAVSLAA